MAKDTREPQEILAHIISARVALTSAIFGLSEDELTREGPVGKWSVKDVMAHIGHWEQVCLEEFEARYCPESRTFTGAVSGLWSVAGNWNPAGVPTKDDSVTLPGAVDSTMDSDFAVQSVAISNAPQTGHVGTFTINSGRTLTVSDLFELGKGRTVSAPGGTITIKGKNITVEDDGETNVKTSKTITMKGQKILQN